jgi:hypothetical protein
MDTEGISPGPVEQETATLRLVNVFRAVDLWLERQATQTGEPPPRSSLGEIDRRTAPYQVSHKVRGLLSSAVDHLHALKHLTVEARALHRCAPTLIRPALENACVAVWLLSPSRRNDRIIRRLRLQCADFNDGHKMHVLLAETQDSEWLTSRVEKLRIRASSAELTVAEQELVFSRIPGYGRIVREAGATLGDQDADAVEFSWRACSGISHADTWATLSINQVRIVRTYAESIPGAGEVLEAHLTADEKLVEFMTLVAARMILHAWELYDLRATLWL